MTEETKTEFPFTPEQVKWIESLESGNYEQCRNVLARYDGSGKRVSYCCLGLAVELFNPKHDYLSNSGGDDRESREAYLPEDMISLLQLRNEKGNPEDWSAYDGLAELNDHFKSFKHIAGILRKHPEQYFTNLDKKK